jgi:ubiquinone/menaquinone biosynthesis C-methylase UbiE
MGQLVNFVTHVHERTQRDYLDRATRPDRAECMEIASRFGPEYWDGPRHMGYGGYRYDGRWKPVAEAMIRHYSLTEDSSILDVGCGKGYLLYEFKKLLPGCRVAGLDLSEYALGEAPDEIKGQLTLGTAAKLPYPDRSFDLVVSNMTLHNLELPELFQALGEITRVSKTSAWICVESWRNHQEKVNLLNWQLTCRALHSPREWSWIFEKTGYNGDYEFAYFT